MSRKKHLRKVSSLVVIFMILGSIAVVSITAAPINQTTLEITEAKGGLGKVSITVKNTGTETAEGITMVISVKGGIFGRVNLTKICSGCGNCTNTILPNASKTESTAEAGKIIGFGPVVVSASAEATNAVKVEKTFNGFVLGLFVIVTK